MAVPAVDAVDAVQVVVAVVVDVVVVCVVPVAAGFEVVIGAAEGPEVVVEEAGAVVTPSLGAELTAGGAEVVAGDVEELVVPLVAVGAVVVAEGVPPFDDGACVEVDGVLETGSGASEGVVGAVVVVIVVVAAEGASMTGTSFPSSSVDHVKARSSGFPEAVVVLGALFDFTMVDEGTGVEPTVTPSPVEEPLPLVATGAAVG